MKDDTRCALSEIRGPSTAPPLSTRIVETQERAAFVLHKTSMRLCVQVDMDPKDSKPSKERPAQATGPIELRHHRSDEYIAVSCPWSLPGHDAVSGRYRFMPADTPGVVMAPDAVLDRVLNYKACNPDYIHTPFWLDKLCINQEASAAKEIAVHSMDLVYRYSGRVVQVGGKRRTLGRTLGLLFVRIDSETKLWVLRRLLDSKLASYNDSEPMLLVPEGDVDEALDLIEEVLSDAFWKRAWIFQEEFLASRHMVLLMPSDADRSDGRFNNESGEDLFGQTAGEIEVWPMNFRTEVTVLCLAIGRGGDEARRRRCAGILRYARRYTFLYRSKFATGDASSMVRAMSPAILEDISTRGITVPADVLAIAANCCRYNNRLSASALGPAASA